jgi:AraC-like DNA-binding protein
MVCDRCILVIKNVMHELNLQPVSVIMGEVDLDDHELNEEELIQIKQAIEPLGFELVSNKKQALIEQIKTMLIKLVHGDNDLEKLKLSVYISAVLNQDYQALSHLFSSVEGITIEKYFIHLKVERIKELLVYDELNLTEISYQLGYSSLAHLSSQFKQITGLTPSAFKKVKDNKQRRSLDKI